MRGGTAESGGCVRGGGEGGEGGTTGSCTWSPPYSHVTPNDGDEDFNYFDQDDTKHQTICGKKYNFCFEATLRAFPF